MIIMADFQRLIVINPHDVVFIYNTNFNPAKTKSYVMNSISHTPKTCWYQQKYFFFLFKNSTEWGS